MVIYTATTTYAASSKWLSPSPASLAQHHSNFSRWHIPVRIGHTDITSRSVEEEEECPSPSEFRDKARAC